MSETDDLRPAIIPGLPRGRGRPRSRDRMAIIPIMPPDALRLTPGAATAAPAEDAVIAGQLSPHTRRAYEGDILLFQRFIGALGRTGLREVSRDDLLAFRAWLVQSYAPATVNRRLSVVRSLFKEALLRGEIERDPTAHLRLLRLADESPTAALTAGEARALLDAVDRSHLLGLRDYALLSLLIRTGLRRSEIGPLRLSGLTTQQGHHVLTVIGKGNKRRIAKLPVDVWRDIQVYVAAREDAERRHGGPDQLPQDAPLFVEIRRVGRGDEAEYRAIGPQGLSADAIWVIVKRYLTAAGITASISPHSLRHTFITLALEGHAPLHKVQYAAGHADPRTTERYHHRKENLDDNATDYVKI